MTHVGEEEIGGIDVDAINRFAEGDPIVIETDAAADAPFAGFAGGPGVAKAGAPVVREAPGELSFLRYDFCISELIDVGGPGGDDEVGIEKILDATCVAEIVVSQA